MWEVFGWKGQVKACEGMGRGVVLIDRIWGWEIGVGIFRPETELYTHVSMVTTLWCGRRGMAHLSVFEYYNRIMHFILLS
jgi:hypothetical protein